MAAPTAVRFPRETYEITSPRLVIRTALDSDAESLHQFLTTAENFPHTPYNKELTVDKLRGAIGRWKNMQANGDNAFLIIVLRQTGEIIGQGSYNCFEWSQAPAAQVGGGEADETSRKTTKKKLLTDVGVMLDHRHWRKGLGAEAVCSLVEFAVEGLGCSLFRTETGKENDAWKGLIRCLGLSEFESFGPQSYDEKVQGWVWKFDADDWQQVRAKAQESGKWPL